MSRSNHHRGGAVPLHLIGPWPSNALLPFLSVLFHWVTLPPPSVDVRSSRGGKVSSGFCDLSSPKGLLLPLPLPLSFYSLREGPPACAVDLSPLERFYDCTFIFRLIVHAYRQRYAFLCPTYRRCISPSYIFPLGPLEIYRVII